MLLGKREKEKSGKMADILTLTLHLIMIRIVCVLLWVPIVYQLLEA